MSRHSNSKASERLGETRLSTKGEKMTITGYRNVEDITVTFEDGTVRSGMKYKSFKTGGIRNPNAISKKRVGEVTTNNEGFQLKIIVYRGVHDIDVQFDDGIVKKHCRYWDFKHGYIKKAGSCLIGVTSKNDKGEVFTIREYMNASNLAVEFEDGTKVEYCTLKEYREGTIYKDSHQRRREDPRVSILRSKRIGEMNTNLTGETMTIVGYRNARDVDVQFSNGGIKKHVLYQNFQKGSVKNPLAGGGGVS